MSKSGERIRSFALSFPESTEDHPWGETAFKVRGKIFVVMNDKEGGFGVSMKLPQSRDFALDRDFCSPTHYGMGAKGWVTAKFGPKDKPPFDLLEGWIEESYGAIAPKKVLAALKPKD